MFMKRIVLCFDGTWDKPEDHTNVYHFYESVRNDGQEQLAKYFKGVGTDGIADRILGGIFGEGISSRIKEGYAYLVQQYELGDEIFLVGFSRGAYTARSLVGLIRKAGLLRTKTKNQEDLKNLIEEAYGLYRLPDLNPDTDKARTFRKKHSYYDASKENAGEPLYTNPVKIKFLGVWNTVGALGIPSTVLSLLGYSKEETEEIKSKEFHDVKLSGLVENAFHALAIDEHRGDFWATLWNPERKPQQRMEQVWFVGAHTDVGGGAGDSNYDTLSKIALKWMQRKANECGLEFYDDKRVTRTPKDSLAKIYDSYTSFVREHAKDFIEKGRHYREIGTTRYGHEIIHESVNSRLDENSEYRPQNLVWNHVSGRREKGRL